MTGTPDSEIKLIVNKIGINDYFEMIVGSPKTKSEAIKEIIEIDNLVASDSVLIGDSLEDLKAANYNNIEFKIKVT